MMQTAACGDSYLFVEKTFTLGIGQIPDLERHTPVTGVINSRKTSEPVDRLI